MKRVCVFLVAAHLAAGGLSFAAPAPHPQKDVKPGAERWKVKTSVAAMKARVMTWEGFVSLENPPGVKKDDPRYQDKRIPEFPNSAKVKEGDVVSLTCWFHLVAAEPDGDYHIQVSNDSASGSNCVVVEVPRPDADYVGSDSLRSLCSSVREWIRTKLLHDASKEPSASGNVMAHAPLVTVTGQLFFDDAHVGGPPRGKKNMKAATLWEIHPVTAISFAAPSRNSPLNTQKRHEK